MAQDAPASVSLCLEVVLVLDLCFSSSTLQGNLQIHHVGQDGQVSAHVLSLNARLPCGPPDLASVRGGVGNRTVVRRPPWGRASASPAGHGRPEAGGHVRGGAPGDIRGFVGC